MCVYTRGTAISVTLYGRLMFRVTALLTSLPKHSISLPALSVKPLLRSIKKCLVTLSDQDTDQRPLGQAGGARGATMRRSRVPHPFYSGLICNKDCALAIQECSSYVFTLSEINDTKQTLTLTGTYSFILGNNVDQFRLVTTTPPSLCKGAKISLSVGKEVQVQIGSVVTKLGGKLLQLKSCLLLCKAKKQKRFRHIRSRARMMFALQATINCCTLYVL